MGGALTSSLLFHAAVIAVLLIGLPFITPKMEDIGNPISVEIVQDLEEKTDIAHNDHIVKERPMHNELDVQRVTPDSRFQPTELGGPIRGMNDPVPAGRRQSRAAMVAAALKYPEGLRVGNFSDAGTPFAPTAYRVENGVVTAGAGCGRPDCSLYAQRLLLHPGVIPSVVAVDEENATLLLWMNFGDTGSYGENRALVTFEGFKVWGGEIHAINAFFAFLPANTSRFWNSSDRVPARF